MKSEILLRDNAIECLKTEVEMLKRNVSFWKEKAEAKIYEVGHKESKIIQLEAEVYEHRKYFAGLKPVVEEAVEEPKEEGKVCSKCTEWKPYSEFYKNKDKGGYQTYCKKCHGKMTRMSNRLKSLAKTKMTLEKEIKSLEKYPDSEKAAVKLVNLEETLLEINQLTVATLKEKKESQLKNIEKLEAKKTLSPVEKATLGTYKKNLEKTTAELKSLGAK